MGEGEDSKGLKSEEKKNNGGQRDDVCRDFLKNICNRGSRCKFYHPENVERQRGRDTSPSGREYNFCIDFQNRGCQRENCRFVHAHRDDVDRYKQTGEVTLNLARAIAAVHNGDTINGIPFCKEFQTGSCSRGAQRCRYWHINIEEERERRRRQTRGIPPLPGPHTRGAMGAGLSAPFGPLPFVSAGARRPLPYGGGGEAYDSIAAFSAKRARYDLGTEDYVRDLERKNAELSKEVESLKRELQHERERYEDLFVLFRQGRAGGQPVGVPPVAGESFGSGASNGGSGYYPNSSWSNSSRSQWTQ